MYGRAARLQRVYITHFSGGEITHRRLTGSVQAEVRGMDCHCGSPASIRMTRRSAKWWVSLSPCSSPLPSSVPQSPAEQKHSGGGKGGGCTFLDAPVCACSTASEKLGSAVIFGNLLESIKSDDSRRDFLHSSRHWDTGSRDGLSP
jgi:hypothetical protein